VLVGTPIGNLGDLSPRAVEILRDADMIAAEDTRRTRALLTHLGVPAGRRLHAVHAQNEVARAREISHVVSTGATVAVVTDAGMPSISDPGGRLVRACIKEGLPVEVVPGPSAVLAALVLSGLATDRFVFEGFLPRSGRDRERRLVELADEHRTTVIYEAPHRIERTLADLRSTCGDARAVVVCRELTKLYETVIRGTLGTIDVGTPKGEYVVVLGGAPVDDTPVDEATLVGAVRAEIEAGASTRDAAATVARRFGVAKRAVYALAITAR
jgi:16S rRNA (cytidine1402-2'-O)-methyltransferase